MKAASLDDIRPLHEPPRGGEDQAHGQIGGVLGEHAWGIGDDNATGMGGGHVDVIDPNPEIGDQLELLASAGDQFSIDSVRDRWSQNVGAIHRRRQGLGVHRGVVEVELGVEQLAHTGFDRVRELACDDDFGLARGHERF